MLTLENPKSKSFRKVRLAGDFDEANLYRFEMGNPVNRLDPMGTRTQLPEGYTPPSNLSGTASNYATMSDSQLAQLQQQLNAALQNPNAGMNIINESIDVDAQIAARKEAAAANAAAAAATAAAAAARAKLAQLAKSYVNSHKWLESPGHWKCSTFVADAANEAGAPAPITHQTWTSSYPPTAGEWGDPTYNIPHWHVVPGGAAAAQPGDIIAEKIPYPTATGHCGIVIGPGHTASSSDTVIPQGTITDSDWGFRSPGDPRDGTTDKSVVRRYSPDP